ncbi:MAG: hypothetical protein L0G07_07100, partial [Chryseobacterium sp.]|nr:hypothetical protein [Chryseobacterium sp.]
KCNKYCDVDEETLRLSHRNSAEICSFSSRLFPELEKSEPCQCSECRSFGTDHSGIYVIKSSDVKKYRLKYNPVILRHQLAVAPEWNFGNCKGLGFDRILIYPTKPIMQYLKTGLLTKTVKEKTTGKSKEKDSLDIAKFYVAVTRARYSVAIVYDYTDDTFIDGINKYFYK